MTQVEFFVGGNPVGIGIQSGDIWTLDSWDSTDVPDGPISIQAKATDDASTPQTTTSASVTVTVDNIDEYPTASMTAPNDLAIVSGTNVALTADASDDGLVASVMFYVDGVLEDTDTNGGDGWSASWNSTSVADGDYVIHAEATDNASPPQTTVSMPITVAVDNSAPPATVHVHDLDGGGTAKGRRKWRATVSTLVHDAGHTPVSGATVFGSWSTGHSGECVTSGSGRCDISKSGLSVASVTFSVGDIVSGVGAYDSSANDDPDGDSDGTVIAVVKP